MNRLRAILAMVILVAGDILTMMLSFTLGYLLRGLFTGGFPGKIPVTVLLEKSYFLLLYPFVFAYEGLYTKRLTEWEELRHCCRGVVVASALLTIFLFMVRLWIVSRFVVLLAIGFGIVLLPTVRRILKTALIKAKLFYQPLILLGDEKRGREFIKRLERHTTLGYSALQFISRESPEEDIQTLLRRVNIFPNSLLVVLGEAFNNEELEAIFNYTERNFAEMIMVLDQGLLMRSLGEIEQMGDLLVLRYRHNLLRPLNIWTKEVIEFVLTVLVLILLLPIFGIIALLVKMSSPGPVFFKQPRIGKDGKIFTCIKFRTMYQNASERLTELLKKDPEIKREWDQYARITNDPRVTRIGRFLRRTSLDELPQLFNVLCGEMALVGPRPYLPEEMTRIGDYVQTIVRVRPGMTGLWQVSGRAELPFEERILLDEYYIRNWSLWLDFSIVMRTLKAVLSGKGAY